MRFGRELALRKAHLIDGTRRPSSWPSSNPCKRFIWSTGAFRILPPGGRRVFKSPTLDNVALQILGPAADFKHAPGLIEPVIPRVGVRLQLPAESGEKRRRPVAFMGRRRVEDHLLREGIEIGPEPPFVTAAPL